VAIAATVRVAKKVRIFILLMLLLVFAPQIYDKSECIQPIDFHTLA